MVHAERPVLVTGAGGFIGGHLVADLVADGFDVRAVYPTIAKVSDGKSGNLELGRRFDRGIDRHVEPFEADRGGLKEHVQFGSAVSFECQERRLAGVVPDA